MEEYTCVVLIAGGVGITPFVTVARHLQRLHEEGQGGGAGAAGARPLRAAWLRWSVRDTGSATEWVPGWAEELGSTALFGGRVEVRCTREEGVGGKALDSEAVRSIIKCGGRMDVEGAVRDAVAVAGEAARVAVLACGPETLIATAQGAAARLGAAFHSETFLL